jgi:hypothetical protein
MEAAVQGSFRNTGPLMRCSWGRERELDLERRSGVIPEHWPSRAPPLEGAAKGSRTSVYDRVMTAVDAAVAVADAYGVHCEKPIVLGEAWHVLVHLWPSPVVARVTSGAPGVDLGDVERELAVARHAVRRGAPVVRPSDLLPPGPHRYGGHTLVFWQYLGREGEVDSTAAGRGLRRIHDSLVDYNGELPRAGRAEEVRAMLQPFPPSDDVELLCELASRELPEGQALHGDAHLFNCIQIPTGPIWHDLETACRGPREYDLAALVLSDRSGDSDPEARLAIAGYGDYDEGLLDQALPVYAAWIAASFMVAVARRPDAAPALERELRFLRRFRD